VSANSQNQIFTDQGNSDRPLLELLNGLGIQHRFLLFKNAAAELQLAYHSGKLRFRLKKNAGEILYTSYVSKADKIIAQAESFLSGGESFHQYFVFSSIPKGLLFDFEAAAKAEQLKREEAERVARREREEAEKAAERQQKLLVVGRVSVSVLAVLLIAGFVYVKTFSHVALSHDLLESEQDVRVVYSPKQIRDVFHSSPIVGPMREAREQGLSLSKKLQSKEQQIDQLVNSKSAERSRLMSLPNEQLIKEFPAETIKLAEVPADKAAIIVQNVRRPAPGLDTKELAKALRISYREALRLKWDLDTPLETVISPSVSHTEERTRARSAAIEAIMTRFEDELPLKLEAEELRAQLTKNQETKTALQRQALDKIKHLGFVKPTSSWFQVRRKPCLLIFEEPCWIFDLTGKHFIVELALPGEGQRSFLDYLLQLYSPTDLAPSTLTN
jgi:hypothetical protein